MEDIIGIVITTATGSSYGFLTWGRIVDVIDDTWASDMALQGSKDCALDAPAVSARVCRSLQEIAKAPYFYEGFFLMCNEGIPFGKRYKRWKKKRLREHRKGTTFLYFLGRLDAS